MGTPVKSITRNHFDAVLFDLDGVLTSTARIHSSCWKTMFDDFLSRRAAERKEPLLPFDIETDYKLYVDGKPRYVFPRRDCALLPIPNTTVEMLAEMLIDRLRAALRENGATGITAIEMEVEENFGQSATCRLKLDETV